jgi:hypothetical protein
MSEKTPSWAVPGARVVVVDNGPTPLGNASGLSLNQIVTIKSIRFDGCLLIDAGRPRYGFRPSRFRPLVTRSHEQDMAIFRPILDQIPVDA